MPEFDREGWAVCRFCLQGGKLNEAPTEKKTQPYEGPLGGPSDTPLFKGTNEGLLVPWITS